VDELVVATDTDSKELTIASRSSTQAGPHSRLAISKTGLPPYVTMLDKCDVPQPIIIAHRQKTTKTP